MKQKVKIVTDAIDTYLQSRDTSEGRATGCFHPSELHQCPRKIYDSYMGIKLHSGMSEPRLQRVADNGHGVHARIQAYLRESGLLVDDEVAVHDEELQICGHCDGIIRGHISKDDNLGVLEIKSINETGFRNLFKPKPEHVGQVSLYMFLLDLKWGCLLYENKNDQRLTEFFIEYDKRNVLPLLDKIRLVKKYIRIQKPPPKDKSFPFCDWCDHSGCF